MKIVITIDTEKDEVKVSTDEKKFIQGYDEDCETCDGPAVSQYARWYDEKASVWTTDLEYNLAFLKMQQDRANDMLKQRGHLFLNEVYDMLGMPRTNAGQRVGWIYDEKNPIGDNHVDFGLNIVRKNNWINGIDNAILLDFNVDGVIDI